MKFEFWLNICEKYKSTALYYSNYKWICQYEEHGNTHFSAFIEYIEDDNNFALPPYDEYNELHWANNVLRSFSDQYNQNLEHLKHSHLGTVNSNELTNNHEFCALKPTYSLLRMLAHSNKKQDFLNQAQTIEQRMLDGLTSFFDNEIDQTEFDEIHENYNVQITELIRELINYVNSSEKQLNDELEHKIAENPQFTGTRPLPTPVIEDSILWITHSYSLVTELAKQDQLFNVVSPLSNNVVNESNFYEKYLTSSLSKKIKDKLGLYQSKSMNKLNAPLFETSVLLRFNIEENNTLYMVKPGFFNYGDPTLWAYSNHKDNFGRTVQLSNGKEGLPEALVSASEIMSYCEKLSYGEVIKFNKLEDRNVDKVTVETIIKNRNLELEAIDKIKRKYQ